MPEPKAFLSGFNIYEGLTINNFTLKSINIEHNVIIRYHEYEYPITLTFTRQDNENINKLLTHLNNYTSQYKIIYSAYGNPYKCTIDNWKQVKESKNTVPSPTAKKPNI